MLCRPSGDHSHVLLCYVGPLVILALCYVGPFGEALW